MAQLNRHRTRTAPRGAGLRVLLLALTAAIAASTALPGAQLRTQSAVTDLNRSFDIRVETSAPQSAAYLERVGAGPSSSLAGDARAATIAQGIAALRADDTVETVISKELRTVEVARAKPGGRFLTAPAQDRVAALRGFLSAHAPAFGLTEQQVADLELVADYSNPSGNMSWVELRQTINGIPVFRGSLRAGFTARNELAGTTGQLAPGLEAASLATLPAMSAADAVSRSAAHVGWQVAASALTEKAVEAGGRRVTLTGGQMADEAKAWQVYFPLATGVARLAWATEIWGEPDVFLIVLDAEDGTVLFRKNLTNYQTQPVSYTIYNDDSPAPASPSPALPGANYQAPFITRTTHTLIGNEAPNTFNNLGWITDGDNTTEGNNVIAGIDRLNPDGVDAAVTGSGSRVFNFMYDPATDDPLTLNYQRGDVTNMFYWTNQFHDATYRLGFTEPAGNFQNDNFGRGGLGLDRVSAEGQDIRTVNNASFTTPADGSRGRLEMHLWTGSTPDRSGDLDRDIMIHELTHGLSNRLHANATGLTSNMAQGVGEGWSDFFARALFATPGEDINGIYTIGGWATHLGQPGYTDNYYSGIRRFPYALMTSVGGPSSRPFNPLTFADIDSLDFNITDGAYPRGPFGSATADQIHNMGEVFASALFEVRARFITRLGFAAGNERILQFVTAAMGPGFDPVNPTMLQARDAIIAAANAGGGDAADIADIWAGFAVRGMGVYASIENEGTGNNDTRVTENFNLPGEPLPSFTINDVSVTEGGVGTTTATFTVTLTNPSLGTSRVTYSTANGTASGGTTFTSSTPLSIPSAGPASVYPANLVVSGLTGTVQRVTVTLNVLSHEFPEDLDVLLVGPGGQRIMLMSDAGGLTAVSGVNLTFADGAPPMTSAALVSGSYAPTSLAPDEDLAPPAPARPYSSALSALNGSDPNGTWSLYVQDDEIGGATGTLGSFSLFITTGVSDYVPAAGQLEFPPGVITRTLNVTVRGDTETELDETFFVNLSNPVNATITDGTGVGTILADDPGVVAIDDFYTVGINTPLVVGAPGVLANDISVLGAAKVASLVTPPASGSLTLSADGAFTYIPATSFVGSVSFAYRGSAQGTIGTVTITVSGSVPMAVNDVYNTPANTPLTQSAPGVLANDNANSGGPMTAIAVSSTINGSVSLNADGSFSYTPNPDFVGVDSFTYRASNAGGSSNVATVTINVLNPTTPQPPRGLTVYSVVGNLVTLRWTNAPIGPAATDFHLEGGFLPGQTLAVLATGSTYPIFTFIAPTGAFYIRLHQVSGGLRSAPSNEVPLFVNVPVTPSPPTGLVSVTNGGNVDLVWRNTFGGGPPTSLIVEATGPISGSLPLPLSDQLSLNGLLPAGTYTMWMRASNAGGVSGPSNTVTVTVPTACEGPPLAPANFLLYKAGGVASAVWDPADSGPAATSYVLNVIGPFTGGIGTTTRMVSGVPPPGTYTVSVVAINACGSSPATAVQTLSFP